MPGHWRDCQEWRHQGLPLSTTSNEAAKLYDAAISQMFRYRDDPTLGGLGGTVKAMLKADPNFVMAHILGTGMSVLSYNKTLKNDPDLQTSLDNLVSLSKRPDVTWREKCFVDATVHWAHGGMSAAEDLYDQILVEYPTDGVAVLMSRLAHLYQGQNARHRDNMAQAISAWKPETPYYGYINGLLSFGFAETNYFQQAEEYAKKALSINADDAMAVHALAHTYEGSARSQNGIAFMKQTETDWKGANFLAHHHYWHWALMYIDQGDYETALGLFDSHVKPMCLEEKGLFSMTDYTALLKRLELEGVSVGDRWEDVRELVRPYVTDHRLIFHDYHLLLGCLGLKDKELTATLMDSLQEFVKEGSGDIHEKMKKFGSQILYSLVAYDDGDYARATELMNAVRYDVSNMAGSNPQNDILQQYLIHAAMKSSETKHHKLARQLIAERQIILHGSPMAERFQAKFLALHMD